MYKDKFMVRVGRQTISRDHKEVRLTMTTVKIYDKVPLRRQMSHKTKFATEGRINLQDTQGFLQIKDNPMEKEEVQAPTVRRHCLVE